MGRESDDGVGIIEFHIYFAIREYWCATDELDEPWAVKIGLIEKGEREVSESRGVDEGHEIL